LREDRAWLLDILEALEKNEKYAAKGEASRSGTASEN
jgi:hypothetical protein